MPEVALIRSTGLVLWQAAAKVRTALEPKLRQERRGNRT
jgi:hypothetical protein